MNEISNGNESSGKLMGEFQPSTVRKMSAAVCRAEANIVAAALEKDKPSLT